MMEKYRSEDLKLDPVSNKTFLQKYGIFLEYLLANWIPRMDFRNYPSFV